MSMVDSSDIEFNIFGCQRSRWVLFCVLRGVLFCCCSYAMGKNVERTRRTAGHPTTRAAYE